jgi:hypothetical protein
MGSLRSVTLCVLMSGLLLAQEAVPKKSQSSEYPTPEIREEQTVVVNGVPETWQLKWTKPPKPYCGANENSAAITCPCTGFAYGESGDLYLLRLRNGSEIDQLHVTPLFEDQFSRDGTSAIVQRWEFDARKDFNVDEEDTSAMVSKRPTVELMHFADYDHDGNATEFYLQTEALPCGKSYGVVLGISKTNPQLHALGSSTSPDKPLYLQKHEWEALRDATGTIDVIDWECGDHGADTQTRLRLSWTPAGIQGMRREFTCPAAGIAQELIQEYPL